MFEQNSESRHFSTVNKNYPAIFPLLAHFFHLMITLNNKCVHFFYDFSGIMRIFIPLPPNFLSVTVLLWPAHVCCSEVNSIAHWVNVFTVIKTIDSHYISVVSSDTWGFHYIHSVIGSFHCWFVRIGWQNKQNIAGLPQAHVLIRSADLCPPGRCVTSLPLAEIQNIWISLWWPGWSRGQKHRPAPC